MLIQGTPDILRPCNGPLGLSPAMDTVFAADPNSIASPSQVTELYQVLLGRDPDEGGLAFYTSGFPLSLVIQDIQASDEYKARQALLAREKEITTMPVPGYQDFTPMPGPVYEELPPELVAEPKAVPVEMKQRAPGLPTLDEINSIYVIELGRNADSAGLAFYFDGQFPIDVIIQDIRQSPEWKSLNRANRIRVARADLDALYVRELGRKATDAEAGAFVDAGRTLEAEQDLIRKSSEFAALVAARKQPTTTRPPVTQPPTTQPPVTQPPAAQGNIGPLVLAVAAAYLLGA